MFGHWVAIFYEVAILLLFKVKLFQISNFHNNFRNVFSVNHNGFVRNNSWNIVILIKVGMLRFLPSSIHSWSIGHILEHELFCLGHLGWAGSKGKNVDLSFKKQLLRVVFSNFCGQKKFKEIFKNVSASPLKSYIK